MSPELPAAAVGLIGQSRTRQCQVTARDIKRFAQAIGETDPIHYDERQARAAGHPGIVGPALFCQSLTYDDLPPDQLPPDGSPIELDVPIPATRTVGGGSEYRIHRLVRAGETVVVTSTLRDVIPKQGKSGLLYLVVVETRFAAPDGEAIATEVATYIKR